MNVQCPPTLSTALVSRLHRAVRAEHDSVVVSVKFNTRRVMAQMLDTLRTAALDTHVGAIRSEGCSTSQVWWLSDGSVAEAGTTDTTTDTTAQPEPSPSSQQPWFRRYKYNQCCTLPARLKLNRVHGFFCSELPVITIQLSTKQELTAANAPPSSANSTHVATAATSAVTNPAAQAKSLKKRTLRQRVRSPVKLHDCGSYSAPKLPFDRSEAHATDKYNAANSRPDNCQNQQPVHFDTAEVKGLNNGDVGGGAPPSTRSASAAPAPVSVTRQYFVHAERFRVVRTGVVFELSVSTPVSNTLAACEHALHGDAGGSGNNSGKTHGSRAPHQHEFYMVARSPVNGDTCDKDGVSDAAASETTRSNAFRRAINALHNFLQLFNPKLEAKAV